MTRASARPERALLAFAAMATVALACLIAAALATTGRWDGLDPAILQQVRAWTGRTGGVIAAARAVTLLGNTATLWAVTLAAAAALAVLRRRRELARLLAVTATGALLTTAIKAAVDRPRPPIVSRLVDVTSASFPSGHAMSSAFVYGTLALIAAETIASPRRRGAVMAAALVLVSLIGASRVVLGVHWPTDVLAGWAIGATWAALGGILARRQS